MLMMIPKRKWASLGCSLLGFAFVVKHHLELIYSHVTKEVAFVPTLRSFLTWEKVQLSVTAF